MKIIVMDETGKGNLHLTDLLQKKKHKVVSCPNSAAFLDALNDGGVERIMLNVESWQRGRAIYKLFDIPAKTGSVPVTFYNAPDNFTNIPARARNEKDRVLAADVQLDAVAESVE
jgi:hypothetical protein